MPEVVCMVCDKPENTCTCDRYCCMCNGSQGIRMCVDGQYYCQDCREACEISTVEKRGG